MLYMNLAAVAAHAKLKGEGFRQKDVRFLLELFSNWIHHPLRRSTLPPLHNTQIQRYLDELLQAGRARRLARKNVPLYRLTRTGVLELLETIRGEAISCSPEAFFFIVYFLRSYRELVLGSVEDLGASAAHAYRTELEAMLDSKSLVKARKKTVDDEITYWRLRIEETDKAASYAKDLVKDGKGIGEIAKLVEARFPYELNFQKPLAELLEEVAPDLQIWELTTGNVERSRSIWRSRIALLEAEQGTLGSLGK